MIENGGKKPQIVESFWSLPKKKVPKVCNSFSLKQDESEGSPPPIPLPAHSSNWISDPARPSPAQHRRAQQQTVSQSAALCHALCIIEDSFPSFFFQKEPPLHTPHSKCPHAPLGGLVVEEGLRCVELPGGSSSSSRRNLFARRRGRGRGGGGKYEKGNMKTWRSPQDAANYWFNKEKMGRGVSGETLN